LRHVAKEKFTLLVLIVVTGGVCQKATAPEQSVSTPRSQATAISLVPPTLAGKDFYVAPAGSSAGDGSLSNPWDLATALGQPGAVQPGDTIWLRGGTYVGTFTGNLTGLAEAPITVRQYPGERATLDGAGRSPGTILTVHGAYTVYRDFEVMSSTNPTPDGGGRPEGLSVSGANTKLVNLVIHDTGSHGITFSEGAVDSEISGCLIYHNGTNQLDHGIYAQNINGTKWLLDNIFFRNYGFGIHAYAQDGHLNNFDMEGNVSFENGKLNPSKPYKSNILLGAGGTAATSCTSSPQVAQNPRLVNNYTYHPRGAGGREIDLGYSVGSCNPTAIGNYLVGDTTLNLGPAFGTIAITDNTFYGPVARFSEFNYPGNLYLSSQPAGVKVFVRPNQYEAGRANITVYNWNLQDSIGVDISSVVGVGAQYEIRNAQNFFASPVASGTYSGGSVSLPMTGLSAATPVGWPSPSPTGPEFNAFILITTSAARLQPTLLPRTPRGQPRPVRGQ
jgi:hypothetical protein